MNPPDTNELLIFELTHSNHGTYKDRQYVASQCCKNTHNVFKVCPTLFYLCERRCAFSTSVRSSLRACAASLLSSFSPFLSTASITWRRSGSHTTALLPCFRSCGEHKHRNKDRCTRKNAESCTGEVINKRSVRRVRSKEEEIHIRRHIIIKHRGSRQQ